MEDGQSKTKGPVSATLSGIANVFKTKTKIGELLDLDRVDGVRCLVTGANSGLGKAVATELARRGGRVVMAGRTLDPSARQDIVLASGNTLVEMCHLDLASLSSVIQFVGNVMKKEWTFGVVVLNAAVVTGGSVQTEDGFDEMFQVNYLSNVLLVETLLQQGAIARGGINASAKVNESVAPNKNLQEKADTKITQSEEIVHRTKENQLPRIVAVSSEAHRWTDEIHLASLGTYRPFGIKGVMPQYSFTKFCMAAYLTHLASRLQNSSQQPSVSVHAVCPGAINSNLARSAPKWSRPILKIVFTLFFASPQKAAKPVIYLSCAQKIEAQTGLYLHLMTPKSLDPRAVHPDFYTGLSIRTRQLLCQSKAVPTFEFYVYS